MCVWIVKLLVERLSYITRCTFDAYAQSSLPSMSLIYGRDYLVKTSFQSNRDKKCWYVVQRSFYRKLCKFCVVFLLIQQMKHFYWVIYNCKLIFIPSNKFVHSKYNFLGNDNFIITQCNTFFIQCYYSFWYLFQFLFMIPNKENTWNLW